MMANAGELMPPVDARTAANTNEQKNEAEINQEADQKAYCNTGVCFNIHLNDIGIFKQGNEVEYYYVGGVEQKNKAEIDQEIKQEVECYTAICFNIGLNNIGSFKQENEVEGGGGAQSAVEQDNDGDIYQAIDQKATCENAFCFNIGINNIGSI